MSNTQEWCAAGVSPSIKDSQNIPVNALAWLWKQFSEVGYTLIPNVNELPAAASNESRILKSQSVHSVCAYPLYIGTELVGFVGCDLVTQQRQWGPDIVEFLSLKSDLLSIALEHRQLLKKREQVIEQLERAESLAKVGHWRIDYATSGMHWSQELFRLFECDPTSYSPNLQAYLELVHPDERVSLLREYEQAAQTQSQLHLEHRILLGDAKVKHLEVRGRFERNSAGRLIAAEGTAQDVTEKVQHRESLQRLAYQDSLTGLPNLRALEQSLLVEMDECERLDQALVLALVDLDNFREINEQYSAVVGDALLKALAQRIRRTLGDTAMLARVGGDEFVVLFTGLQRDENYAQQLNRVLTLISQPLLVEGVNIVLHASMGVTTYPQRSVQAGDQLMRQAQQALFQAKMLGKGRFYAYDTGSEQSARERSDYLDRLRAALHAGEFVLYYQPKVDMKSGTVFGVEALIRWRRGPDDWVMPGEFLPALQNHPLEIELGDWVIRTALAQMRQWKEQGLLLQVSVNIISQQLFDVAFVDKLSQALDEYPDITPSALQLEILESSMLDDLEAVSEVMCRSGQMGVSFALDDFGTGYSSLAHLKHLPARVLKIDRSFVHEMMENSDDLSIISGVIGMAKAFGMQVIAEGVETLEQGCLLLKLGCEQAQGYVIAKPLPSAALLDWLQQWAPVPEWVGRQAVGMYNVPLLYAEVEHRHWVLELKRWLHGQGETIPALEHHLCKVGVWMDSEARQRFAHNPLYSRLERMHRTLHRAGKTAVSLHAKGEVDAALALLPDICATHEQFVAGLQQLME